MSSNALLFMLLFGCAVLAVQALLLFQIIIRLRSRRIDAGGTDDLERMFDRQNAGMRDEVARNRQEIGKELRDNREELSMSFQRLGDTQGKQLESFSGRLDNLTKTSVDGLDKIRQALEESLRTLRLETAGKLDEMRQVVDEKLQQSVEKRFNESFRLISERLDQVHKGLGEMQNLAHGVGDLKKVLGNVKTRGVLGEFQLGAILEQYLTPDQYETNVAVKPHSAERVEFAVRMPGGRDEEKPVYLPVDSKFPLEDYQRLLDAYDHAGETAASDLEHILKSFEASVRRNARSIHDKYISPPYTTDFALMFVPTEGLYAEILRRNGLFESLNREFKVAVVGPANLMAFLNSLQMGFRTLAIEKRSSEVWNVLGAIKTEFGKFGEILEKTKLKLTQAVNVIDNAQVRSRAIQRRLKSVQELPSDRAEQLLAEPIDCGAILDGEESR